MKNVKRITGILSIIFTCIVLFQSWVANNINTIGDTGDIRSMAGFALACMMLAGGIVELISFKSEKRGGSIVAFILFLIAALLGAANAAEYTDLLLWAVWCAIAAVINFICMIRCGTM